jgi:hypothetical protein
MSAADSVVTKLLAGAIFGNDATDVVTNVSGAERIGNDESNAAPGFIRIRKRALHPKWRGQATASMSFDLVRAERVNGKPRHKFVLGLGSQQSKPRYWSDNVNFWTKAILRMTRHGIPPAQRSRLIAEMVRKGARLPTPDDWGKYVKNDRTLAAHYGWKASDGTSPGDIARAELLSQFPIGNDEGAP